MLTTDRPLAGDIETAARLVAESSFLEAVESAVGALP
jgi:hypothetical protein